MGQYHSIYNVDKKETFGMGGVKLWEHVNEATAAAFMLLLCNSNGRGGGDFTTYPTDYDKLSVQDKANQAIIDKVSGRWAGDRIVVQGDYAEETDPGYIPKEDFEGYKDISIEVAEAILIAVNGDESRVVEIIESELAASYGLFKSGLQNVEKVKGKDRNKQTVELYQAIVVSTPKKTRRSKTEIQQAKIEKFLEQNKLSKDQALKLLQGGAE